MDIYSIPVELERDALDQPERGMGYQEVKASFANFTDRQGLLIAGLYFIPIEISSSENRKFERRIFFDVMPPRIIPLSTTIMTRKPSLSIYHQSPLQLFGTSNVPPPPFPTVTQSGEIYYRLSAFKNDKRITPTSGLAPQTYTTTDNDIKVVPSGLAAVGRYALPSPLPAIHLFCIYPKPGTAVAYGTVSPNYGMSGGGVEAYFPNGTDPGTVRYIKAIPMK